MLRHNNDHDPRSRKVVAALGIALLVALIAVAYGWQTLIDYINPKDATGRKDAVQVYALIVAGVIASITAAVGLLNLRLTRKNLEQQRELEAQRSQGTALQTYYEQIGKLLTDYDLLNTTRKEIRELARGQTLTVLREVDGEGKGSLLIFLHGAGLIGAEDPAVLLSDAPLRGANLQRAKLQGANLQRVHLRGANLQDTHLERANLQHAYLQETNLQEAHLRGANLQRADLRDANLQGARLKDAKITRCCGAA